MTRPCRSPTGCTSPTLAPGRKVTRGFLRSTLTTGKSSRNPRCRQATATAPDSASKCTHAAVLRHVDVPGGDAYIGRQHSHTKGWRCLGTIIRGEGAAAAAPGVRHRVAEADPAGVEPPVSRKSSPADATGFRAAFRA